jgi:hypothetical protein
VASYCQSEPWSQEYMPLTALFALLATFAARAATRHWALFGRVIHLGCFLGLASCHVVHTGREVTEGDGMQNEAKRQSHLLVGAAAAHIGGFSRPDAV